ncbi:bifunctional diaminohydroxyphosphoribosylaminopyrimidine deaminase/5-amino-6-(5-phosphoribosylamino)uracil reductase RibD [Prodigiosinella aquatilis]|uniref:bifunctional diaminohydroxyphosphoribosylaminopyrimidine deaminase/5-amino-6-(5-phosphoribosylamino)uracil reductase RibD n=1 Tax=Brenneria uluponensis TaxID=3057057 RepID=UPI0025B57270|nr:MULTISPECIES: bifunctional diaminohydroxyphosphoribosylaminopyrimidine deaminase/5-amino-6-(5-phosphoribosylamino)uracil reductase RibD [Pectobacteriaceae]WJV54873.1 bifunctional diaminohydroxyphosphoribosylaminopyrimidine deaminase/5-amino-6-(5-phosphoribosylamino)uracil reductase RibD [Prodigiosinella sp. LS101]WJV59236.1 bifunctional diaminohydroxyphosphoribosylaminopyrimidine deaminase/5-amino-6-(5-phosphoribosylamino)uracil reductase RibD [Pectobacteriaceae bacterium C111]
MDKKFMAKALCISQQALPNCLPNPPVGCVIVRHGEIVAEGYTREPGGYHAEADALSLFTGDLSECDVYVTLEPCSFAGRTPSCAIALSNQRPKRVVVGILDTDPRNQGAGIQILKSAGIDVETGILAEDVKAWLSPYLISSETLC